MMYLMSPTLICGGVKLVLMSGNRIGIENSDAFTVVLTENIKQIFLSDVGGYPVLVIERKNMDAKVFYMDEATWAPEDALLWEAFLTRHAKHFKS